MHIKFKQTQVYRFDITYVLEKFQNVNSAPTHMFVLEGKYIVMNHGYPCKVLDSWKGVIEYFGKGVMQVGTLAPAEGIEIYVELLGLTVRNYRSTEEIYKNLNNENS